MLEEQFLPQSTFENILNDVIREHPEILLDEEQVFKQPVSHPVRIDDSLEKDLWQTDYPSKLVYFQTKWIIKL